MTIAAGMLCSDGVIFGADTDESVGDLRRRVHKIPSMWQPRGMVTGSCENGHLMDTAIERIFDRLKSGEGRDIPSVGKLLQNVMSDLYQHEFKLYPDQASIGMKLLVAVKPEDETRVGAWSIDCSAVRRMKSVEIVGYGELVQFLADKLYVTGIDVETAKLAMVQILAIAKKMVQYVGGESCVHYLHNDGASGGENISFSPEKEELYDFFLTHGRQLLLATGAGKVSDEEYERIAAKFIADLKWKRDRIRKD